MYCKNCGKNLSQGEKFCSNCGLEQTLQLNNVNSNKIDKIIKILGVSLGVIQAAI